MASASKKYPQFILFGDSITQYTSFLRDGFSFGAALEEHCQRRLDIINRGLSGYNTSQGLYIIDDIIPSADAATVDYLMVAFGANDAVLPGFTQHVPLKTYQQNLEAIINHPGVKAHDPMILLVAPPPINVAVCDVEDKKRGYSESIRKLPVTAQYAQVTRDVAKSAQDMGRKVTLVDLWTAMSTEGEKVGLQKLLVDGLHFTGDGYRVFYDEIVKHVGQSWKNEPLEAPSWIFPHWSIAPGTVKL